MLQPKKTKFRKVQKGRLRGKAYRGGELAFGDYGLQTLDHGLITARPGILIGKRGADVDALRREVAEMTGNEVFINIREIRKAEVDAQLIAENIALQLERRVAFRRAMKKAMQAALKFGAQGIKLKVSGRLGGAEMSRVVQ